MTPERWQHIEALLHAALEKPPPERSVFLDEACAGDADLRRDVEELITADEAASDDFLDRRVHPGTAHLVEVMRDRVQQGLPSATVPPGTMIRTYELLEEIGRGGMGVVYKARDTRLNRFVALKFLHMDADVRASVRFLAEAQAASALDHPNICTVHEISGTEEGETFIAMAYYEGQTLRQRLAQGPLPVDEALSIATQAAAGLAEAHRHGVVHRDIKPENLILTANGIVKIVDFGLAKLSNLALTQTRRMMGTIAYMSPEQARGEAIDERTDLWALGVVLYEILTGQRPFSGTQETAILYAILENTPPPLTTLRPDVPEGISLLVEVLLRKDPAERFGPMAEVHALLTTASTTERMPASLVLARPRRYIRRRWLAVPVLLLLVLGAWGLWGRVGSTPTPPSRSAIAVLPFFVRGDEALGYLHEGMVDLLSTKLDGVDGLRSIDPHALLGFVDQNPNRVLDPERGREVAAHFGASHYVLGSVVQLGDRLQLNAYLYDTDGMEQIRAQASVTDESELLAALDDLAQQLVAAQLTTPEEQLASLAAMTTTSFPALQAYLNGERALREGRFETAVATLQRAVALDSTFALAWYRLARAAGWTGPAELNERAIARALAYSDHLPERARLLVSAYNAYRNGNPTVAEQGYRALLATYPDYAEAWLLLGETLFHNNPFYGRSTIEAREPLERALAFNPNDREILIHLMDLAAKQQRWDALDILATRYFAPSLEGQNVEVWHTYQALQRIAAHRPAPPEDIFDDLAAAGPAALRTALERIAPPLEDLAITTRLAERLVQPAHAASWQEAGHLYLAYIAVARGQWQAADTAFMAVAATSPGWARIHRVLAYTLPEAPLARPVLEALRDETAQWNALDTSLPGGLHAGEMDVVQAYLLGLLSFRLADYAAVRTHMNLLATRADASSNALARAAALTLEALLAWHREEPNKALTLLAEAEMPLPFHVRGRSPLYEQLLNRYLRAEILFAENQDREALAWYASLYDGYHQWGLIYLEPSYQRRAVLYQRLGERERAVSFYERFIALRQDADTTLQPAVARARHQLDSLRIDF